MVTTGRIAFGSAWRVSTHPVGEALGARRADVVAAHHVEQARTGDAGDDGQRDGAQRDRGQDQVPERVDERRSTGT